MIILQKYTSVFVVRAVLACALLSLTDCTGVNELTKASSSDDLPKVKAPPIAKVSVNTALIVASRNGHLKTVQSLLATKIDVNTKDDDGNTALMLASQEGKLDVVHALINAKADVNINGNKGDTALMLASEKGHLKVVQALLIAGANVNVKNAVNGTALEFASERGHLGVVQALLAAKADVDVHIKIITELPNNPYVVSGTVIVIERTALMSASERNHIDVVQALIDAGADVNARIEGGATALILASGMHESNCRHSLNCPSRVVRALLDAGADVNAKKASGETALTLAKEKSYHPGYQEVVQMLKKAGAKE
jgi:serine/threonine-protein phosphatase 6 regulatory ankyrin repeat subunit B